MADFCRQCAADMWGAEDTTDFEGIVPEGSTCMVICEGCGKLREDPEGWWSTIVDHTGKCIDSECPAHGTKTAGGGLPHSTTKGE